MGRKEDPEGQIPTEIEQEPAVLPPGRPVYITHIGYAEGVAIGDGARVEQREPTPVEGQLALPGVSVTLLTRNVPTARCHHLDATAFPLVTITLDNTGQGCANVVVHASATIEGYSDTAAASECVAQGEQARISLLPILKPAAVTIKDKNFYQFQLKDRILWGTKTRGSHQEKITMTKVKE